MKKFLLYVSLVFSCFLFCGCSGPRVMVDGIEYDALSEEEIDRLCYLAELYLKNNVPKVITPEEVRLLNRILPVCTIQYSGDRTGHAIVRWEFPQKNIEVVFDGKLLTPSVKCWARSESKGPEIIDFTKKGTLQRQRLKVSNMEKPKHLKRSKKTK